MADTDRLLTEEEIQGAWPNEVEVITPQLTQAGIEKELLRCAQFVAQAQRDLTASLKDAQCRQIVEEIFKEITRRYSGCDNCGYYTIALADMQVLKARYLPEKKGAGK